MTLSRKRVDTVDIAKGIGILLVIFGHISNGEQLPRLFIYSFHMPLFFLVSGLLSKPRRGIKTELKKAFRGLYLPYFVFVVIDTTAFVICHINKLNTLSVLKRFGLTSVGLGKTYYNPPIWFLFALFVIKVIFTLMMNIKFKTIILYAVFGACVVFTFFYDNIELKQNVMYIRAVLGFPFFALGFVLKDVLLSLIKSKINIAALFVSAAILFAALTITCKKNDFVNMYLYKLGSPALYFVNALLGIALAINASIIIDRIFEKRLRFVKSFFMYYGRNSIYILCTHCYITRRLFPTLFKAWGLSDYLYSYTAELTLFAVTMVLMIPIIFICGRYLFFLFGKKIQ